MQKLLFKEPVIKINSLITHFLGRCAVNVYSSLLTQYIYYILCECVCVICIGDCDSICNLYLYL